MTKKEFNANIEKIYKAVRKVYGYTNEGDGIIDLVYEMADILGDKFEN